MNDTINKCTKDLTNALRQSPEYLEYVKARDLAFEDDNIKALYYEYRRQLFFAQANNASGKQDEKAIQKLTQLSACLHMDELASQFLMREYALNTLLGDVYKKLARAVDADLGFLDE